MLRINFVVYERKNFNTLYVIEEKHIENLSL